MADELTDARCGNLLPSGRTCRRQPWWPGGRCPQCGYGAATVEEWVWGLAKADNAPYETQLTSDAYVLVDDFGRGSRCSLGSVEPGESARVVICFSLWKSRHKMAWRKDTSVEEAAVLVDKIEAHGICDANDNTSPLRWFLPRLREVVVKATREMLRLAGTAGQADNVARSLRGLGFDALAADDVVVLPIASARQLLARLTEQPVDVARAVLDATS